MKTIAILLLTTLSCFAQYRYNLYSVGATGTNAWIGASSNRTYNSSADVGATTLADLQASFRLMSSNTFTNPLVLTVDKSIDATRWWGAEYFTNYANGTNSITNRFRINVTNAAYLRIQSATNHNADVVTNLNFYIGGKVGL